MDINDLTPEDWANFYAKFNPKELRSFRLKPYAEQIIKRGGVSDISDPDEKETNIKFLQEIVQMYEDEENYELAQYFTQLIKVVSEKK